MSKFDIIGLILWWSLIIMFGIFWIINLGGINWMVATLCLAAGAITATVFEIIF